MTDLVEIGVSFDTSGLEAGTKATDQFADALNKTASASTDLSKAQSSLEDQQRSTTTAIQSATDATSQLAQAGSTLDDLSEVLDKTNATYEQLASSVEHVGEVTDESMEGGSQATEEFATATERASQAVTDLTAKQNQNASATRAATDAQKAAAAAAFTTRQTPNVVADGLNVEALKAKYGTLTTAVEDANTATLASMDRMIQGSADRMGRTFAEQQSLVASWGTSAAGVLSGFSTNAGNAEKVEEELGKTAEKSTGFFSSLIGAFTGYGNAQKSVTEEVKKDTAAHTELEGHASSGIWSSITSSLFGYGSAHSETTKHVGEATHAHSELNEVARETAHVIHALHPELASAGVGMGELSGLARVARSGFLLFAAAIGGTFAVEVIKTQAEMAKLREEFNTTFGEAGPEMLEKTEQAAKALGTTLDRLAPSVMGVSDALNKGRISQEQDQKEQLNLSGWTFQNGDAGTKALQSMLSHSNEIVVDASSQTGKEITKLQQLYQQLGLDAGTALSKVGQFWAQLPQNAEQARDASVKATADFTKLFEVAGKGGDDAAAATQKFFEEIKKGGLTSDIFDKLASESRVVASTIAESFGFKGPEAIERFSVALERVKGISFQEVVTGIQDVQTHIDELKPKDTLSRAWGELKTAFRETFEEIAKGIEDSNKAGSKEEGGGAVAFLDGIAKGLKAIEPSVIDFVKEGIKTLKQDLQDIKDIYTFLTTTVPAAAARADAAIGGGIATATSANPVTGMPDMEQMQANYNLSKQAAGSGATEAAAQYPSDSVFGPAPNAQAGAATIGTSAQDATSSIGALDQSLTKTDTTAQQAKTSIDTVSGSLAAFGSDMGVTGPDFAKAFQSIDQQLEQTAQTAPAAVGSAQSSLQSFFTWLIQAANSVAAAQQTVDSGGGGGGGGGGPQLSAEDAATAADIGSNAVGGIYTIGATGGSAAGGTTRASGTDTISLKGTVSPGEIVAIIPADKANKATMSALQTIISDAPDPISIGGGSISGTDGTSNISAEVARMLDGTGVAYPASLSGSGVKDLLAQIKALLASQYATKNLSQSATQSATAPSGGAQAAQSVDPFADEKKAEAANEKRRQEEQAAAKQASHGGGGGGARPAARAASKGAEVIRLPKGQQKASEGHAGEGGSGYQPFTNGDSTSPYYGGDQTGYNSDFSSYDLPYSDQFYDPYSAYAGSGIGYGDSSYDLPYTDQFYNPYSANEPTGDYNFPDYSSISQSYTSGGFNDTPSADTPSADYSGGSTVYSAYDDSNTVDIGANATGGIYPIGSTGSAEVQPSVSTSDTIPLKGMVSPGEIVAVIPAHKSNQATMATLQAMIAGRDPIMVNQPSMIAANDIGSNATGGVYTIGAGHTALETGHTDALDLVGNTSPGETVYVVPVGQGSGSGTATGGLNVSASGGGGASTLGLTAEQVQAALDKVKAAIAAQLAAKNLSNKPAASIAATGGGGGFNTKPEDKPKDQKQNQQAPAQGGGGGGASGGARAAKQGDRIDVPGGGGGSGAGGRVTPDDVFGPVGQASYDLPYNHEFFDPYSAYAGDGVGYGGNSYDLPYDNYYYDPYSAGAFGDNFSYNNYSFDNSQYLAGMMDAYGMYNFDNSSYINSSNFDYMNNGGGDSGSSYDNGGYTAMGDYGGGGSSGDSGGSSYYDTSGYTAMGDYGGGSSIYGDYGSSSSSDSGSADYGGGSSIYGDYGGGDTGDFATGGMFTVPSVPGGGTDTVDTTMHLTTGETVAIFPKGTDARSNMGSAAPSPADSLNYFVNRGFPSLASPSQAAIDDSGRAAEGTGFVQAGDSVGPMVMNDPGPAATDSALTAAQPTHTGPSLRALLGQPSVPRSLSGSTFGADGSTMPLALDRTKGQTSDADSGPLRPQASDRNVNVNVFGVQNVQGFLQSRMSVIRAMRVGNG